MHLTTEEFRTERLKVMRRRGRATSYFMGFLGALMGVLAVAFPATTLAHGVGLLAIEPPWGFWSSIMGMTFTGLVSVEMFTGNITVYAGELVRSLAERFLWERGR